MPISSPSNTSLVPATQSTPGTIKDVANQFRQAKSPDAQLWYIAGDQFTNLQRQVDGVWRVLQKALPVPDPLQITAADGSLIAQIGNIIDAVTNQNFPGIWADNLYVGGSNGSPSSAPFFSDGTRVVVGKNGQVFILDPYGNVGAWMGTQSEATQNVTGAANNGSGVIRLTVTAHGYRSGDWVNVAGVGGVPNSTGQWLISVISNNTFDLLGSTFAGSYTSGGTAGRFFSGGAFSTLAVAAGQRITNAVNNGSGLVRLTITGHGYKTGYAVVTTNVGGIPGANGSFLVTVIDANTIDLQNSTFSGAYTSGGISINWPTAKLLAQGDGSLLLQNVSITINGPNGTLTITPTIPALTVIDNSGNASQVAPGSIGVSATGNNPSAVLHFDQLIIFNSSNIQVVKLYSDTGATEAGKLLLQNSAHSASITLDPTATNTINTSTGNINTAGSFSQNNVAGVTGFVSLAKITSGGTNGQLTVAGGIITNIVNPT